MPDPPQQYPPPGTTSYVRGNPEDHPKSTDNFRCRPVHSKYQKALPGTSPSEKRQPRQAALLATDSQATVVVALVLASDSVEGAGHPEMESTEAIITPNRLPVR